MIKMIDDPILGVRYITVTDCADPRTESQRIIYSDVQEQLTRTRNIKAKQFRHTKNTKQK